MSDSHIVASGVYTLDETPYLLVLLVAAVVVVAVGTALAARSRRTGTSRIRAMSGAVLLAIAIPALAFRAWFPVEARGVVCGSALSAYLRRDLPEPSPHEIPTPLCNQAGAIGLLEGLAIAALIGLVGFALLLRRKRA